MPACARSERLVALLGSLRGQTLDPGRFEVIVVDDASPDETADVAEAAAAGAPFAFTLIRRDAPGWPRRGAQRRLAPGGRAAGRVHRRRLRGHPGLARGARHRRSRATRRRGAGTHPAARARAARRPLRGHPRRRRRRPVVVRDLQHRLPARAARAPGGLRRVVRDPLGEDTDLGWRALAAGARRRYAEGAVVEHAVEDLGSDRAFAASPRGADSVLVFRRHRGPARARARRRDRSQPRARAARGRAGRGRCSRAAPAGRCCSRCRICGFWPGAPLAAAPRPSRPITALYDALSLRDHRPRRPAPPRAGHLSSVGAPGPASGGDPAPPLSERPAGVDEREHGGLESRANRRWRSLRPDRARAGARGAPARPRAHALHAGAADDRRTRPPARPARRGARDPRGRRPRRRGRRTPSPRPVGASTGRGRHRPRGGSRRCARTPRAGRAGWP